MLELACSTEALRKPGYRGASVFHGFTGIQTYTNMYSKEKLFDSVY